MRLCEPLGMAVETKFSYRYRVEWVSWGPSPRVVLAEEYGVGLDPRVTYQGATLTLHSRQPRAHGWEELPFSLPEVMGPGDLVEVCCTPMNTHRSFTWWRQGELQIHLGHLPTYSGQLLGDSLIEIVNEFEVDGCLALYRRAWTQRLAPGQFLNLPAYQVHLQTLGGLTMGNTYLAHGWLGLNRFSREQMSEWLKRLVPRP